MWLTVVLVSCGAARGPSTNSVSAEGVVHPITPPAGGRTLRTPAVPGIATVMGRSEGEQTSPGDPFRVVVWDLEVPDSWVIDFLGQEAYERCEAVLRAGAVCWTHPFPCVRLNMQEDRNYLFMWTGDCTTPEPSSWRYWGASGPTGAFQVDPASVPLLAMDRDSIPVFGW